jgi:hypothetical protein
METKELTTPNGHKIEVKQWITGRDARDINAVLFDEMEIGTAQPTIGAGKLTKMIDKQIECVVTKVDGVAEGILDKVLDMRSDDYTFIVAEVQKVANQAETDKKK